MLTTRLGQLSLENPTILAAGFLGTNAGILKRVAKAGAGAVTTKSIGPVPRDGNPNPTVLCYGPGLMNAVGLPSVGHMNMAKEWEALKGIGVPVVASIYGGTVREYAEVAESVAGQKPAMIDINIGCPNTKAHGALFGTNPDAAHKVVSAVKDAAGKVPIMPKLTPNTHLLREVAKACEDAGADAIAAINTVGPGMIIDINTAKPIFSFKTAGLSGPAIRPLAVRCVYDIYGAVKVPVVGVGGITYGKDAIEMVMAGATAVEIGSAIYYRGIDVFGKVCTEMEAWMKEGGHKSLKGLVGAAHG